MKKKLPDHKASCGNVFADAGMENANEHLLKARLVSRIQDQIDIRKINQTKASHLMGLAQPDLSNILNGRFRGFSVERLMRCLSSLDCEIEIVIRRDGKTLAIIPVLPPSSVETSRETRLKPNSNRRRITEPKILHQPNKPKEDLPER